jgi:competence protein ComEC
MPGSEPASRGTRFSIALRPALPAAGLFISGVLLHPIAPRYPVVWIGICFLFAVAGGAFLKRAKLSSALLAGALVAAAIAAGQLYAFQFRPDDVSAFASDETRLAWLEMDVITPPRELTDPFNPGRAIPPKQVATVRVTRIKTWSGWVDAGGEMLLQVIQPHPRLQVNQHIRALGMLQRPAPAMNPGQFDWAAYYRDQRILASFQVPQANNIEILGTNCSTPVDWIRAHARRLLAAGFPADRALDHALLRALLLGDSDPQLRDVQEQFQRTGTSHHLAISGMHVAVLAAFVFIVCRLLCLPPRLTGTIITILVILYGIAALPSPPVVRSILLCSAVGLGIISRRSIDGLQLLCVCMLAMLILRPPDLYNAGFQLSFGTVLGLILFTPSVERIFESFRDRDVMIARSFQPPTRWSIVIGWIDVTFTKALCAGVVAWLVSMPLICWHFEQLNPWAIPASLILGIVVFVALVLGFVKILLTLLLPSLAGLWVTLTVWPVALMRLTVDWMAKWPRSDVPLPPPPWWLMLGYYAALLTLLFPFKRASAVWFWWIVRIALLVALLWLPYETQLARRTPEPGSTRITLLAVGAGQCTVVEPPSGRVVLLDAGSLSLSDLQNKCLGPFLRHAGCTSVDSVFLSHADLDHISAAADVAEGYQAHEVLAGEHFARHARETAPGEHLLHRLDDIQRPPRILEPGQRIPLARDTAIEVLWPPADHETFAGNDLALVLRLTHAGRSVLFTGDIEDAAMRELLRDPAKLKSDILVAPHHGSSESLTSEFVAAVDPSAIVSSNDRTLSRKQVHFEGLIGKRPLFRTHTSGAITIEVGADGSLSVTPFLPSAPTKTITLPALPSRDGLDG